MNDNTLEDMNRIGALEIVTMNAKPMKDLTDLEKAILRAVYWFGSSQMQSTPENRLLNLITSIESLMSPKEREPISAFIAEGVAWIIADKFEGRKIVADRMRGFYKQRSEITHGGTKAALEVELEQLQLICGTLIMTLVKHSEKMTQKGSLSDWIRDCKLGGSVTLATYSEKCRE